jgi:hypothetical protein
MTRHLRLFVIVGTAMLAFAAIATAASVDKYIIDLKSTNPEVRAKAAYELGCG